MTVKLAFYLGTKKENPSSARTVDRIICWWTNSRFSHVEFVEKIDGNLATTWSASQRDGGVRSTQIDLSTGRWVLAEFDADYASILQWFKDHDGEHYDYLGVASFVLPLIPDHRVHFWYCSRAIAVAAQMSNPHKTPQDLFVVSRLSAVTVGKF